MKRLAARLFAWLAADIELVEVIVDDTPPTRVTITSGTMPTARPHPTMAGFVAYTRPTGYRLFVDGDDLGWLIVADPVAERIAHLIANHGLADVPNDASAFEVWS